MRWRYRDVFFDYADTPEAPCLGKIYHHRQLHSLRLLLLVVKSIGTHSAATHYVQLVNTIVYSCTAGKYAVTSHTQHLSATASE